jgi:hypothetical protein
VEERATAPTRAATVPTSAAIRPGRLNVARTRAPTTPSAIELIVAALVLAAVGAVAYGAYIAHGGFYVDDWADLAGYHFAHSPQFWTSVSDLHQTLGGRPMLALLLPIPNAVFGVHPAPYLGLAAGLGALTSWCFYLLLRTLDMAPIPALAIGVLALLFPWSDSIRLWPTASMTTLSVCFVCLGAVLALHGLRYQGPRGMLMQAGAALLYALGVLSYEATGAAALLVGALYVGRAQLRTALHRWIADAVVVLAALTYSLINTVASRPVGSPAARLSDLPHFIRQGLALLVSSIVPPASSRVVQAVVLVVIALTVVFAIMRLRRWPDRVATEWLQWCAIAVLIIAATYFMFLGSNLHPNDPGIDNRTNVLAGFGYALFAYSIVALAAHLTLRGSFLVAAAPLAAAVLIAVGYAVHLHRDESHWRRAAQLQARILDSFERHLPEIPGGSTILSFDRLAQAAPEVPIFDKDYDLTGALRLQKRDPRLRAYPVFAEIAVRCAAGGLVVAGPGDYGTFHVRYHRVVFFAPSTGRSTPIRFPAACAQALPEFRRAVS